LGGSPATPHSLLTSSQHSFMAKNQATPVPRCDYPVDEVY